MRAVLADRYDTEFVCDDPARGIADDAEPSSDRISSRGLEILRILNDVFNRLPLQTAATEASATVRLGETDRRAIRE